MEQKRKQTYYVLDIGSAICNGTSYTPSHSSGRTSGLLLRDQGRIMSRSWATVHGTGRNRLTGCRHGRRWVVTGKLATVQRNLAHRVLLLLRCQRRPRHSTYSIWRSLGSSDNTTLIYCRQDSLARCRRLGSYRICAQSDVKTSWTRLRGIMWS